jgi:hypothetical protein
VSLADPHSTLASILAGRATGALSLGTCGAAPLGQQPCPRFACRHTARLRHAAARVPVLAALRFGRLIASAFV